MAPQYKLIYFNSKGRAEVARIIMAYGDIEYEDVRVEKEQWAEMKSTMPMGQLPAMEVDGEMICQTGAIIRLLARRTGLMGKTDMEEAKINMILGCMEDYLKALSSIFHEEDEERKKAARAKFQEALPAETAKIEALLPGDYFVGTQMTLADINAVYFVEFPAVLGFKLNFDDYPKLKALRERINGHQKIAAWIAKRPVTAM